MKNHVVDISRQRLISGGIKSHISDRVRFVRERYEDIPAQFREYNLMVAQDLKNIWDGENAEFKSSNSGERAIDTLERWKGMKKKYRLIGLDFLNNCKGKIALRRIQYYSMSTLWF